MLKHKLIQELTGTEKFFLTTIAPLVAGDGDFRPHDDLYTVTGHLHHVASTITWFIDGAFRRADGFAMDFENHIAESHTATDFDACRRLVINAFAEARQVIDQQSEEALTAPLPDGPIMGGAPRYDVIYGIADHTAHHRGALAVYIRLLNKVPPMPYA